MCGENAAHFPRKKTSAAEIQKRSEVEERDASLNRLSTNYITI